MTIHSRVGAAVIVCSTALAIAGPARAQQTSAPASMFEIAPRVSFGSNGSTDVGAAVRWPLKSKFSVEWEAAYRQAEINGPTTSVNLLYDLPSFGRATPYFTAGAGLERIGSAIVTPAGALLTRISTAFSVNAGGGVRVAIDDRWGLRSDVRWSNGIGREAPERWRVSNGFTLRSRQR
jgi:opacity protein-like surface antigen